MEIIMKKFSYKGYRFDWVEFEVPQKDDVIDETFKEKISEYITETLDEIIKFEREKEL